MNQTQKFIGLLAILPLALVALTPDLIGEADAASFDQVDNVASMHDGDAFVEKWGSISNAGIEDEYPDTHDGSAFEKRLASLGK